MLDLRAILADADRNHYAIGHFNISDLIALRAIFEAGQELKIPVLVGTSEGERDFIGTKQIATLVRSLRDEYGAQIFLNADHTHSIEKVQEAVMAGYDAILFDGGKLPWEENIKQTREVVKYVKSINPKIIVEGEIGYIGSGSEVLKELPAGAAIRPEDLTRPEQALEFVEKTGVDLLAPAVGNVHGIILDKNAPEKLDILRIKAIKDAARVPLVLHGGSGNSDQDFKDAIAAGMTIVHISTELRVAWRKGIEDGLRNQPDEYAPYKIAAEALANTKEIVTKRARLFSKPGA